MLPANWSYILLSSHIISHLGPTHCTNWALAFIHHSCVYLSAMDLDVLRHGYTLTRSLIYQIFFDSCILAGGSFSRFIFWVSLWFNLFFRLSGFHFHRFLRETPIMSKHVTHMWYLSFLKIWIEYPQSYRQPWPAFKVKFSSLWKAPDWKPVEPASICIHCKM